MLFRNHAGGKGAARMHEVQGHPLHASRMPPPPEGGTPNRFPFTPSCIRPAGIPESGSLRSEISSLKSKSLFGFLAGSGYIGACPDGLDLFICLEKRGRPDFAGCSSPCALEPSSGSGGSTGIRLSHQNRVRRRPMPSPVPSSAHLRHQPKLSAPTVRL